MEEVGAIQKMAENFQPIVSVIIVGLMGAVKMAIPSIPTRVIPLVNLVLGIGLMISLAGPTVQAVFAGMMIGFAATGMHSSGKVTVKPKGA